MPRLPKAKISNAPTHRDSRALRVWGTVGVGSSGSVGSSGVSGSSGSSGLGSSTMPTNWISAVFSTAKTMSSASSYPSGAAVSFST